MNSIYMRRALTLAARARGRTSPNPMVGAVIVKTGKKISEGYHRKAGNDHAEIAALKKAEGRTRGATMYVTLEPCNHFGKTPPCTEAIISAGIKKVIAATRDPNPLVAGKGIAKLKRAGIAVTVGDSRNEAKRLNEPYIKFITKKVPFVTVKAAISLDGKIAAASGNSNWISNEKSRKTAHQMRAVADVVMVGVNTLLKDDPRLNVRLGKSKKHPVRLIVDTHLKTPVTAKIFRAKGGAVWIAAGPDAPKKKAEALNSKGALILHTGLTENRINLQRLMKELARRGIINVLLEGGGELLTSAIEQRIADRAAFFIAPILLGGGEKYSIFHGKNINRVSDALRLKDVTYKNIDDNVLVEGKVAN
ncbi:MAG: bifunctional diaminohydroxyphosphoribosylaminopyrimidine deaminase/5-amino-6-(5-phosphoribosylamino)uracil reductase RibD [Nitrospinota bacterium]